jgi:hypothetical protein
MVHIKYHTSVVKHILFKGDSMGQKKSKRAATRRGLTFPNIASRAITQRLAPSQQAAAQQAAAQQAAAQQAAAQQAAAQQAATQQAATQQAAAQQAGPVASQGRNRTGWGRFFSDFLRGDYGALGQYGVSSGLSGVRQGFSNAFPGQQAASQQAASQQAASQQAGVPQGVSTEQELGQQGVSPEELRQIVQGGGLQALGKIGQISKEGLGDKDADWVDKLEQLTLGREPMFLRAPAFTGGQFQQLGDILGAGSRALGESPYSFEPIAAAARQRFQQQTIPGLAERFAGMGGLGSSSFGRQMGQAGKEFETNLAGQQSQFNLQRQPYLNQLLGLGMTSPYLTNLQAAGQGVLPGLIGAIGKGAAAYMGG